jgi:hypothetical protein
MIKRVRKVRKQPAQRDEPRVDSVASADELGASSRALLGEDADARKMRPQREDASVEDPLRDWPED